MKEEYLTVGKVKAPFGLKGEVEITVLTDWPSRFLSGLELHLSPPLKELSTLVVEKTSVRNNRLFLKFKQINNRTSAERIKGCWLKVTADNAVSLPKDNYWHHQILGLNVLTDKGLSLGRVEEIIRTGSNDVYVVRDNKNETLIPAIKKVVRKIDLKQKKMIIQPVPGLLDLSRKV